MINFIKSDGKFDLSNVMSTEKLEQLEHLHSEIPPTAPWLPTLMIHIRFQVKTRQNQSYKFKKIAKILNFEILLTLQTTHLLKLFNKMYEYEMVKWIQPEL